MALFYGEAGCSACHSGKLFTDQQFHALGLPVLGPGRTRAHDPMPRDTGRMAESDRLEDSYRFRTPSLRNVEVTGPYGHNGAYNNLADIIKHHLNPSESFAQWQRSDASLPSIEWLDHTDFIIKQDTREMARYQAKLDIKPQVLSNEQLDATIAFLKSLTGYSVEQTPLGVPDSVPSGLPVDN